MPQNEFNKEVWLQLYTKGETAYYGGNYPDAETYLERAAAEASDGADAQQPLMQTLVLLGYAYSRQHKFEKAENTYNRVLEAAERAHPDIVSIMANARNGLASVYLDTGRNQAAETILREGLKAAGLDRTGDEWLMLQSTLGQTYIETGNYIEAKKLYEELIPKWELRRGSDDPGLLAPLANLAIIDSACERYVEAERLERQALHVIEQSMGFDHPDVVSVLINRSDTLLAQAKPANARLILDQASRLVKRNADFPVTYRAALHVGWGELSRQEGNLKEAESELLSAQKLIADLPHNTVAQIITTGSFVVLGNVYLAQERFEEAESMFKQSIEIIKKQSGSNHPNLLSPLEGYETLLKKMKRLSEQTNVREQIQSIRKTLEPCRPTPAGPQ